MKLTQFFNNKNINKYKNLILQIREIENKFYNNIEPNLIAVKLKEIKESSKSEKEKILHAIALANKASQHTLRMSYYDVQLMGALALVDGCVAEMKTGEGKTLTCSAAVAANYALGFQTHVATANEYLAKRDQETLEPLYSFLGISSNFCVSGMEKHEKKESYKSDVVYSTAQELGFDFLRDNLVYSLDMKMQPLNLYKVKAIIDEADFILIDEARTPLIISGEAPIKNLDMYLKIREIALKLEKMDRAPEENPLYIQVMPKGDFWVDEKHKTTYISESGYEKIEALSNEIHISSLENTENSVKKNISSLYQNHNLWILHEIQNALKAQYCYIKDKDYIVHDGEILIVDQNTGRISKGRSWSNGLHQAIEAKENVKINPETVTLGSISIQNYFRNYLKISGMSGTVMHSSEEFSEIYQTTTIQIPTNRPLIRKNHNDKIYLSLQAKYNAIITDVIERHKKGQPILIGTTSVSESEQISQLLSQQQIKHHVLNAKNHLLEAQIIAQAGQPYSVTVSTSMAGRGTDIILGGNKEALLSILSSQQERITERKAFFQMIIDQIQSEMLENDHVDESELVENQDDHIDPNELEELIHQLYEPQFITELLNRGNKFTLHFLNIIDRSIEKQRAIVESSHTKWREHVLNVGGLYVLGSSRNESRRIDDQLRGRSGRQGDPGESCFYLSIEDPWVNVFGKNPIFNRMAKTLPPNEVISSPLVNKAFEKAQSAIESFHFGVRKDTFQYDSISDEGRRTFLKLRNLFLTDNETIKEMFIGSLKDFLMPISESNFYLYIEELNVLHKEFNTHRDMTSELLSYDIEKIKELINNYYSTMDFHKKEYDSQSVSIIENFVVTIFESEKDENFWSELNNECLRLLDKKWTDHLVFLDDARNDVGFSAMIQKNPLYEFKKICFDSFSSLISEFRQNIIENFYYLKNRPEESPEEDFVIKEPQIIEEYST